MKFKVLLLSSFIVFIVFNVSAGEVTPGKARLVATNCYFEKAVQKGIDVEMQDLAIKEDYTIRFNETNSYYVFTFHLSGFVIVSADDVLPPVLGYSLENGYRHEDQPDSYRNFMQTYSDAVEFVRKNQIKQDPEIRQLWDHFLTLTPEKINRSTGTKGVEPLLLCLWDQGYPYNALCPENPEGPGGHVYAGCVATAMAQVMYYWRYPLQGTGSHSYYYPPYGNISANFGATEYQWEGMLTAITHDQPAPIAELQFHCGVGVDMMYSPNGSGAYSSDVPPALENYFGYSNDCYFTWKDDHSNSEWINMLKDNIDNGWPMYYSGFSNSGGHAFVCDGYDGDLFHFNFGWSGSSNGFYTLLNVGGFNSGQGAVFDTYPGSGYPYYCSGSHTLNYMKGNIEDGSGPVAGYQNNSGCSWLIDPQTSEDSVSSITISFLAFDTETNDMLTIYDGSTTQDNILGEFSGSQIPDPVTSSGNQVLIVFNSDGTGTGNGWHLQYIAHSPDYCKGLTILTEPTGNLSDGSGSFNYHNNSSCMWKIEPGLNEPLTIGFTEFNTENEKDRVFIFDLETQELLAEYSGNYTPPDLPAPVTSYSGRMFVAFSSNSGVTSLGWKAVYSPGTTGLDNAGFEEGRIRVFPVPATEQIIIDISETGAIKSNIYLITLTGQTVFSCAYDKQEPYKMGVAHLPRGVYLIKITTGEESFITRVILR
ncbi:MAG: C10 family peptidase [Bacteroidales bacterium]|nr:C10 family peptidase [Bacteroidales bacterium]